MSIIYCINSSTLLKNTDMYLMINALNTMLPAFCNAWSPTQHICQASSSIPKSGKYCVFLDNSDSPNALAYHTEISGLVISKVFVGTILKYKGAILMGTTNAIPTVAQAFAHEIFEMILNSRVNIWWQLPNGYLVAGEVSDPVQGAIVQVKVGSIVVGLSDYILPAWYDSQSTTGPYNYLNTLTKPFQLSRGGYVVLMKNGVISNVMGSEVSDYIKYKIENKDS